MTKRTIKEIAAARGVSRLCHFTQSRNLPHIFAEGQVLSTEDLRRLELPLNPNDTSRLDDYETHISCSVEYPNAWFLATAVGREALFKDWVVLGIDPALLWDGTAAFCPVNAATRGGRYVDDGPTAFELMYDLSPPGSRQARGMLHLDPCPTDNQAEALVGSPIAVADINSVICASEEQCRVELARLQLLGSRIDGVVWKVSPEIFDARRLAGRIQSGERPKEWVVAAT